MTSEAELLLRYLDGEMSAAEAESFRARLAESPALCQKLAEMRRVGELVRTWAAQAEGRAGGLVEPTLKRVAEEERRQARTFSASFAVALLLVLLAPWSATRLAPGAGEARRAASGLVAAESAAVERLDTGQKQAQVFVVGAAATTVVWLSDEGEQELSPGEPGPG